MKTLLRLLAGAWLAAALAAPAHAIVIFNNLLPSAPAYNDGVGYAIDASTSHGDQWVAGASGTLTDLYLGMSLTRGQTGDLILLLFADAGNTPGLLPLATFVVPSASVPAPGSADLLHIDAAGDTALVAGNAYWLVAGATGDVRFAWGENAMVPLLDRGLHLFICSPPACDPQENVFTANAVRGALRVEAAAVPEPLSLALVGVGLAGLGWSRRRRRA